MEAQKSSTVSAGMTVQLTVNNPTPPPTLLTGYKIEPPTASYLLIPLVIYLLLLLIQSLFIQKLGTAGIVMALKRLKISLGTISLVTISISLVSSLILLVQTKNLTDIIFVLASLFILVFEILKQKKETT